MLKAYRVDFHVTEENLDRLFECNRISATVWNDVLVIAKNYHLQYGKWINKTELQKALKQKYPLPSQSIQAVAHKYLFARNSAYEIRRKGLPQSKYPYKKKKNFNTKWVDKAFTIHPNGKIELHMGIQNGKRQKPIVVYIKDIPLYPVREIELIYNRRLMLCLIYDDGAVAPINNYSDLASVDLGEIHSISAYHQNGNTLVISGRKMRSIHQFRNKKIAELQRKMGKCQKGSRQWKKYNRALRFILSKSEEQLRGMEHKTSKQFVDWCVKNQTKKVIVGNVEGVQRNTKKKKSKKTNQKLSNWRFGKLQQYMEYKLKVQGMEMQKVDESYTTQTCPVCSRRKKPSGRIYRCKCGYECHRDIHGARNIMSKYLYQDIRYVGDLAEIKYLRIG